MNRKLVFVLFLIFFSIFFVLYAISTNAAPPPPAPTTDEDEKELIEQAILDAIDGQREFVLGYLVNDVQVADVQISQDGTWGVVYLEMVDPETGQLLPSEPGLAIARRIGSEWVVILPSDPNWIELVKAAPPDLLTDEYKISYEEMYRAELLTVQATFSGYLLPWEAGKKVYLSQSTGHDKYIPSGSAHYSFDFYISKTMYQLRASKSGTVWRARWDVPNGDDSDMGNYIVLKDTSTSPTTYQLYLHLAKGSIPAELRTQGTFVPQGQFIGIADDTGQSTGHHLHFHVHTNPNSYWGTSVDITFDDVDINGGRPRRESDLEYCTRPGDVCKKFSNSYISQNGTPGDTDPPIGDLFEPATGTLVNSSSLHVEGWSFDDDSGLNHARLIAYYDDEWHEVGPEISDIAFSMDWDMCSDDIPDGPVSLALRIWDNAGNPSQGLPGLTHLIKNFACGSSQPACIPGVNQIGIYSESDYQGDCQILDPGNYPVVASPFNNTIDSIQVGANVVAQLFNDPNYIGRSETITRDESDLEDNPIGGNQISSLKVAPRTTSPQPPAILLSPNEGEQFPSGSSLSFSWRDPGGGTQFQVSITGPNNDTTTSEWLATPYWNHPGTQSPIGSYTWRVRARNCPDNSCTSSWSDPASFTITSPPPALLSASAPFIDDLESGTGNWNFQGLWKRINDPDRSHSSDHSWYYGLLPEHNYDTGGSNFGNLTSKPISIPGSNYVLRFWYRYDTEENGANWDQRWVQISADGEPFDNILQLVNDEPNHWRQATLDLSGYDGQTLQFRFYFTTLDDQQNDNHEGWLIDDIEIIQENLPGCSDSDDSPAGATTINFDQTVSKKICPSGDVDYFKFEGQAGDHIVLDIDTPTNNPVPNLDLYLFLLDSDGQSLLAQHDDEILGIKFDPHLGYQLSRSGTYYVRARLWSHPSHGGEDFSYDVTLTKDNDDPQGAFIAPSTGSYLNDSQNLTLTVDASDLKSGISHVEFLFHPSDWLNSEWQVIGSDQDSSDGWQITFDTTELPEQKDIAFFANIYDWAGNWNGAGVWEIGLDRKPPSSSLSDLAPVQQSTAIYLQWSGTDNMSGINFYNLQSQIANGSWSNIQPKPGGADRDRWFIGKPGTQYGFRIRGVDYAGNQESFPSNAEITTEIPNAATLCSSPDHWDSSGNDNSPGASTLINIADSAQIHNFCNPLVNDRLSDEDWFKFNVENGVAYVMESIPLSDMTGTILELYAADAATLLTTIQSSTLGMSAKIIWTSDRDDLLYLRVRHVDGNIAGNVVSYRLNVYEYKPVFLPIVHQE